MKISVARPLYPERAGHRRALHASRGFTLTELLIVLTVGGILMATTIPNYNNFVMNNRLRSASAEFAMALTLARTESGKRGVPVTVAPVDASANANEWGPGWTVFVDDDSDRVLDAGEEVIARAAALVDTNTLDDAENATFVEYRPSGVTSASPAERSFELCDTRTGETGREIRIRTTGRIEILNFNCA